LLKQESEWLIWYYSGVVAYKHYVPITRKKSDIFNKIEWARKKDREAKKIAEEATKFARNDLSIENTYLYFYKVLCEYAKLQK
jgi:hypothetical protein